MVWSMKNIISIVNQKGGVGKTTTAVNLAATLSAISDRILVVDCDPQGNTGSAFGISNHGNHYSLYECMENPDYVEKCIMKTFVPNLDIIPSHTDLYGVEIEYANDPEKHLKIKKALGKISGKYSYIILDCPPGLGILSLNALVAAQRIIIPVQCEYYALEGLSQILKTVDIVQKNYNEKISIAGLLLTMYDTRNGYSQLIAEDVRKNLPYLVYETIIPRNVRIAEAPSYGRPVMFYDVKSVGAQAYIAFAKEFVRKEKQNGK